MAGGIQTKNVDKLASLRLQPLYKRPFCVWRDLGFIGQVRTKLYYFSRSSTRFLKIEDHFVFNLSLGIGTSKENHSKEVDCSDAYECFNLLTQKCFPSNEIG